MKRRSFRLRLISGMTLWTLGALGVIHVLSAAVLRQFPDSVNMARGAGLAVVGLGLMAAGLTYVRSGVSPFSHLRERLSAVHEGRSARVEGVYPSEVQPLVDDLNALLDHRDQAVRRAQSKAGDLAHGLKTPLALLAREAEEASAHGQPQLAEEINRQVIGMRRQVDYHLAQTRAAAAGATSGARCSVLESVEGLSRTLRRLYVDRELDIAVGVRAEHEVQCQREDLEEMLGNLFDNACKWAGSHVSIGSSHDGPNVVITIDDDGPGIDSSSRDIVLQRGVRADETEAGSGLGLAITRDLAELYGGSISLHESPMNGLRAELQLPAC